MSESSDFKVGPGISTQVAEAAQSAIQTETVHQDKGKPITFIEHNVETRAASNSFLQGGDKTAIASMLGIPESEVSKRFRGSQVGITNNGNEFTVSPGRTDLAYTILALGDLSCENGLPALGRLKVNYTLKSGQALHFMGDVQQTYCGTGGGTLIWFNWGILPSTS